MKDGIIRHLPLLFSSEHGFRSLPALREILCETCGKDINTRVENPRYRVALFGGCLVDFVYPEQARALVKLAGTGVQLEYPDGADLLRTARPDDGRKGDG